MPGGNWIQLDDQRSAWLFLILGWYSNDHPTQTSSNTAESNLAYWEFGVGNATTLVETTADSTEATHITSDSDLVETLLQAFDQYRYQNTTLITPRIQTLHQLRQLLVRNTPPDTACSLRGFTYLSFERLLDAHFNQSLTAYGIDEESRPPPRLPETGADQVVSTGAARAFYDAWTRVFRLVPPSALRGDQL
jgi:hypothetical protein